MQFSFQPNLKRFFRRTEYRHERAVKTLRNWGVSINEAFFLGGVSKTEVLAAFGAHIFFDDQDIHTEPASTVVPAATVPYRDGDNPKE